MERNGTGLALLRKGAICSHGIFLLQMKIDRSGYK
jgi:hypothetical protein